MATSPAQNPPLPQQAIEAYAKYKGISVQAAAQELANMAASQTTGTPYSGFNLDANADTGPLFKGFRPTPFQSNYYQQTYARGTRVRFDFGAQHTPIKVAGLNLPPNWHAKFITVPKSMHVGYEESAANLPPEDTMTQLEIINDKNEIVNTVTLSEQQTREMRGQLTPLGLATHMPGMPGLPEYTLQLTPEQWNEQLAGKQQVITGTIGDELKSLYGLAQQHPDLMRQYKHELWMAGYYGSGVKLDQVDMNTITNEDISAFGNLFIAASRYMQAGQHMTWQQLLGKQAQNDIAGKQAQAKTYRLTDPASTIQEANAIATKVLGRGPSSDDVRNLVSMVEQNEQSRKAATEAGGGFYTATDPQADIEQYFRQKYPGEAQATDMADRVTAWRDLLKTPPSGGPAPEITPRGTQ